MLSSYAGAGRLVLTHIAPTNEGAERKYVDKARESFDGQIIVARDHQALVV